VVVVTAVQVPTVPVMVYTVVVVGFAVTEEPFGELSVAEGVQV
jgi:hypothetical protein